MADVSIRNDFIEGVQEVFTTLFNNGSENDGVFFYALSDKTEVGLYQEQKYKVYKDPVLLVCKAEITPTQGAEDVEEIKDSAEFTVTLKSLMNNNLGTSQSGLAEMRKGVMKFHGVFYIIDNIIPKAYVEDVFLMYRFQCTEDIHTTSIILESDLRG